MELGTLFISNDHVRIIEHQKCKLRIPNWKTSQQKDEMHVLSWRHPGLMCAISLLLRSRNMSTYHAFHQGTHTAIMVTQLAITALQSVNGRIA